MIRNEAYQFDVGIVFITLYKPTKTLKKTR